MSEASTRREGVLERGDRLGRYEIISLIARGGMGAVYLARVEGAGGFSRLVAIKVMHPHLADEEEFIHMLVDEARVASRIHHPNAVAIVDLAESPHGYYLTMDYVDGVTLTQLRRSPHIADEMKTRLGLKIVLDALAGLHSAHELTDDDGNALNIVHRDVSPHNILVGTDGVARITDFGIALAAARITASRPGMIKGKPQYMAPEQVLAGAVDRRADVFCAGIITWEFLTRGRLFHADSDGAAMLMVHLAPIARPSSVLALPEGFDDVCMKALERDPNNRYPTARAFADALEDVIEKAGWALSSNDVAEHVTTAFADDIAQRKALIRDHNKSSVKGARAPAPAPAPASSPKETSRTIPAIEVGPAKPSTAAARRVSVVPQSPVPALRKAVAAGAFVAIVGLAVGAWWSQRERPSQRSTAASQTSSPVLARTPAPVVEAPPPAREAIPAASPPDATVAVTVEIAPTPAAPAQAPSEARRHRARSADAGAATTTSSDPALETNPYLRR